MVFFGKPSCPFLTDDPIIPFYKYVGFFSESIDEKPVNVPNMFYRQKWQQFRNGLMVKNKKEIYVESKNLVNHYKILLIKKRNETYFYWKYRAKWKEITRKLVLKVISGNNNKLVTIPFHFGENRRSENEKESYVLHSYLLKWRKMYKKRSYTREYYRNLWEDLVNKFIIRSKKHDYRVLSYKHMNKEKWLDFFYGLKNKCIENNALKLKIRRTWIFFSRTFIKIDQTSNLIQLSKRLQYRRVWKQLSLRVTKEYNQRKLIQCQNLFINIECFRHLVFKNILYFHIEQLRIAKYQLEKDLATQQRVKNTYKNFSLWFNKTHSNHQSQIISQDLTKRSLLDLNSVLYYDFSFLIEEVSLFYIQNHQKTLSPHFSNDIARICFRPIEFHESLYLSQDGLIDKYFLDCKFDFRFPRQISPVSCCLNLLEHYKIGHIPEAKYLSFSNGCSIPKDVIMPVNRILQFNPPQKSLSIHNTVYMQVFVLSSLRFFESYYLSHFYLNNDYNSSFLTETLSLKIIQVMRDFMENRHKSNEKALFLPIFNFILSEFSLSFNPNRSKIYEPVIENNDSSKFRALFKSYLYDLDRLSNTIQWLSQIRHLYISAQNFHVPHISLSCNRIDSIVYSCCFTDSPLLSIKKNNLSNLCPLHYVCFKEKNTNNNELMISYSPIPKIGLICLQKQSSFIHLAPILKFSNVLIHQQATSSLMHYLSIFKLSLPITSMKNVQNLIYIDHYNDFSNHISNIAQRYYSKLLSLHKNLFEAQNFLIHISFKKSQICSESFANDYSYSSILDYNVSFLNLALFYHCFDDMIDTNKIFMNIRLDNSLPIYKPEIGCDFSYNIFSFLSLILANITHQNWYNGCSVSSNSIISHSHLTFYLDFPLNCAISSFSHTRQTFFGYDHNMVIGIRYAINFDLPTRSNTEAQDSLFNLSNRFSSDIAPNNYINHYYIDLSLVSSEIFNQNYLFKYYISEQQSHYMINLNIIYKPMLNCGVFFLNRSIFGLFSNQCYIDIPNVDYHIHSFSLNCIFNQTMKIEKLLEMKTSYIHPMPICLSFRNSFRSGISLEYLPIFQLSNPLMYLSMKHVNKMSDEIKFIIPMGLYCRINNYFYGISNFLELYNVEMEHLYVNFEPSLLEMSKNISFQSSSYLPIKVTKAQVIYPFNTFFFTKIYCFPAKFIEWQPQVSFIYKLYAPFDFLIFPTIFFSFTPNPKNNSFLDFISKYDGPWDLNLSSLSNNLTYFKLRNMKPLLRFNLYNNNYKFAPFLSLFNLYKGFNSNFIIPRIHNHSKCKIQYDLIPNLECIKLHHMEFLYSRSDRIIKFDLKDSGSLYKTQLKNQFSDCNFFETISKVLFIDREVYTNNIVYAIHFSLHISQNSRGSQLLIPSHSDYPLKYHEKVQYCIDYYIHGFLNGSDRILNSFSFLYFNKQSYLITNFVPTVKIDWNCLKSLFTRVRFFDFNHVSWYTRVSFEYFLCFSPLKPTLGIDNIYNSDISYSAIDMAEYIMYRPDIPSFKIMNRISNVFVSQFVDNTRKTKLIYYDIAMPTFDFLVYFPETICFHGFFNENSIDNIRISQELDYFFKSPFYGDSKFYSFEFVSPLILNRLLPSMVIDSKLITINRPFLDFICISIDPLNNIINTQYPCHLAKDISYKIDFLSHIFNHFRPFDNFHIPFEQAIPKGDIFTLSFNDVFSFIRILPTVTFSHIECGINILNKIAQQIVYICPFSLSVFYPVLLMPKFLPPVRPLYNEDINSLSPCFLDNCFNLDNILFINYLCILNYKTKNNNLFSNMINTLSYNYELINLSNILLSCCLESIVSNKTSDYLIVENIRYFLICNLNYICFSLGFLTFIRNKVHIPTVDEIVNTHREINIYQISKCLSSISFFVRVVCIGNYYAPKNSRIVDQIRYNLPLLNKRECLTSKIVLSNVIFKNSNIYYSHLLPIRYSFWSYFDDKAFNVLNVSKFVSTVDFEVMNTYPKLEYEFNTNYGSLLNENLSLYFVEDKTRTKRLSRLIKSMRHLHLDLMDSIQEFFVNSIENPMKDELFSIMRNSETYLIQDDISNTIDSLFIVSINSIVFDQLENISSSSNFFKPINVQSYVFKIINNSFDKLLNCWSYYPQVSIQGFDIMQCIDLNYMDISLNESISAIISESLNNFSCILPWNNYQPQIDYLLLEDYFEECLKEAFCLVLNQEHKWILPDIFIPTAVVEDQMNIVVSQFSSTFDLSIIDFISYQFLSDIFVYVYPASYLDDSFSNGLNQAIIDCISSTLYQNMMISVPFIFDNSLNPFSRYFSSSFSFLVDSIVIQNLFDLLTNQFEFMVEHRGFTINSYFSLSFDHSIKQICIPNIDTLDLFPYNEIEHFKDETIIRFISISLSNTINQTVLFSFLSLPEPYFHEEESTLLSYINESCSQISHSIVIDSIMECLQVKL